MERLDISHGAEKGMEYNSRFGSISFDADNNYAEKSHGFQELLDKAIDEMRDCNEI